MAFWGRAQVPPNVTSGGASGRVAVENTDQPSDDADQWHRHGVCIPWSWVTGPGLSSEEPRAVVSEAERSRRDEAGASSDGPGGQVRTEESRDLTEAAEVARWRQSQARAGQEARASPRASEAGAGGAAGRAWGREGR